jgi:hypothetical protein
MVGRALCFMGDVMEMKRRESLGRIGKARWGDIAYDVKMDGLWVGDRMARHLSCKRASVRERIGVITRASVGHLPRGDRVCMGRAVLVSRGSSNERQKRPGQRA